MTFEDSGASASASFTPTENGKTYKISATYDYKCLVLKNSPTFYLDESITASNLKEMEWELFNAICDTNASVLPGLDNAQINITYLAGTEFYGGGPIKKTLDHIAYDIPGSRIHTFGAQAQENVYVELTIDGKIIKGDTKVNVIKRSEPTMTVTSPIELEIGNSMLAAMKEAMNAQVANDTYKPASQTTTVVVKKALNVADIEKEYVYAAGSRGTVEVDLGSLIPADGKNVVYTLAENTAGYIADERITTAGLLTYSVNKTGGIGNETELIVTVSSDNYMTKDISVKVKLLDKYEVSEDSDHKVEIDGSNVLVYEQPLSDLKLNTDNAKFVANGQEVEGTLSWTKPESVLNAGTVKAEWTFTPTDTELYKTLSKEIAIVVNKATGSISNKSYVTEYIYNMSPITAPLNTDFVSNAGVTEFTYEWYLGETKLDNPPTEVGNYVLKVIAGETGNYTAATLEVPVKISEYVCADATLSGSLGNNDWYVGDVEIIAPAGHMISTDKTVWSNEIEVSTEMNENYSYYLKNDEAGYISNEKEILLKLDKTAPEGNISFNENPVKKFLNEITFNLFFNAKIDVKISSEDNLSEVDAVEYYVSEAILDENAVNTITEWKKGSSFSITEEDAKKVVVYVKIRDKAGNISLFGSDGSTFDLKNPEVTGIESGKIYYTTQVANISDKNLGEVTLNGNSATVTNGTASITLAGKVNADTTYTIKATDKAGNETIVTVTMKPLSTLASGITAENITLNDITVLKEAESYLEDALKAENLSKLLDGEEGLVEDKLASVKELLGIIDKVQDVIDQINNLPKAKDVVVDDEDPSVENDIRDAMKAYKDLSDYEKSLISQSLKNKLFEAYEALTDYRILDGDGKVWVYDTNGTLTFTGNGPVRKFKNALVDGKAVPADDMRVRTGSTVVELDASYLYWLGLGDHTFQIEYTDGKTDVAEFSVVTAEEYAAMFNQPKGTSQTGAVAATGDSANILLWGAALAVGAIGMVVVKKRRKNEEA